MTSSSLLKFQIGPVQDFIAAARSTRDLWSGSYLLSYLVAAGIRAIPDMENSLIFPNPKDQPLLKQPSAWPNDVPKNLLTPNLPNLFVASVPVDQADAIAKDIKRAIKDEWQKIATAVWKQRSMLNIPASAEAAFDNAVAKHLSIAWQITPIGEKGYTEAYRDNGWHLDAVRQTRDFAAWGTGQFRIGGEKDSLTGKEETLCGGRTSDGKDFHTTVAERFRHLFKHNDQVGAITLIKRVWHLTYLKDELGLKTGSDEFNIRSIPAIAARSDEHDDSRDASETSGGDRYIAAIAFDGDFIGKWVDGKELSDQDKLRAHHSAFSAALSDFALNKVREIVNATVDGKDKNGRSIKVPLGQLIYAGGDDVVALVPADAALDCAAALRGKFRDATKGINDKDGHSPDASAGIAIAHIHAPLQDLIREAQRAEKRAKNIVERPAFSVTLMKRSGEISEWGAKWEGPGAEKSGGLALYQQIATLLDSGKLTGKFPHRVCALLDPYLISHTGLTQQQKTFADTPGFQACEIIQREFAFAIARQSAASEAVGNNTLLMPLLTAYLSQLGADPQTQLTALIGLCTTVAFTHRTRPDSTPAEKQPAP